jgi:hypothetical protein
MIQGQLGQSSQLPFPGDTSGSEFRVNAGLLGNEATQFPSANQILGVNWLTYLPPLTSPQPAFKLALLKGQTFTAEGRESRILASLEAINSPQPISLSLAEWKEIVEEVEDED